MAKAAKIKQTDYTRGGRDISNTAIPLYQSGLTQLSDYTMNPDQYRDELLNKYYTNTPEQNDFLNNFNRTMANTTANNYASTAGGYSSAGNRAYGDTQKYQNDLAARLYNQGITGAQNMLNSDISNLRGALGDYNTAYGLGKEYSKIDQYNDLVDQQNGFWNQISGALPTVGTAIGSMFSPVGAKVGGAIGSIVGNQISTDTSGAMSALGVGSAQGQSTGAQGGQYGTNTGWNNLSDIFAQAATDRADAGKPSLWNQWTTRKKLKE